MSDQEVTQQSIAHEAHTLAGDLMCLACGYNLRGLPRTGNCPECGYKIDNTIIARQGMTKRELAALAYRVTVLWTTLAILTTAFGDIGYLFSSSYRLTSSLIWIAISIVILATVWWKAHWLAHLTFPVNGPVSLNGRVPTKQIMAVACSVIGVLYVLNAISNLAWSIISILTNLEGSYAIRSLIMAALNLVIGGVMLLGAGKIAAFVLWLRTAGTNKAAK